MLGTAEGRSEVTYVQGIASRRSQRKPCKKNDGQGNLHLEFLVSAEEWMNTTLAESGAGAKALYSMLTGRRVRFGD